MTTEFLNSARREIAKTRTELYTVPALRASIIGSVLASPTVDALSSNISPILELFDGTNYTQASFVSSSAVALDLLADPMTANAAQVLYIRNDAASNSTSKDMGNLPITSTGFMGTPTGSVLVAYNANFIYRSTDGGLSWTGVYSGTFAGVSHAYIDNTFFIYITTTQALKSTDAGVTWALDNTVTNAPVYASGLSPTGRIINNGATFVGAVTSTQLVSSTTGIAWTNMGVVIPSGTISQLTFSGVNYVVASANVAGIHYSTDGAAWTTVALPNAAAPTGIASNGAGTVVAATGSAAPSYSTDHGATWNLMVGTLGATVGCFYTGMHFVMSIDSNLMRFMDPAMPMQLRTATTKFTATAKLTVVTTTKCYYGSATRINATLNTDMSQEVYGMNVIASYAERVQ